MESGMSIDVKLSLQRLLAGRVRLPQHVVFRAFPAETVVLNLDTGKYHSLNPSGGRFLEMLEQARSGQDGLGRLQEEFPDQDPAELQADLHKFCIDLADRGLIEIEGGS